VIIAQKLEYAIQCHSVSNFILLFVHLLTACLEDVIGGYLNLNISKARHDLICVESAVKP